jgi:uncharacterized membrane protein
MCKLVIALLALNFFLIKSAIAKTTVYHNEEEFMKALRSNMKVVNPEQEKLTPEEALAQQQKLKQIVKVIAEYIASQVGTKEEVPTYQDYQLTSEEEKKATKN